MCYDREKDPLLVSNFKLSVCDTDKGDRQTPLTKLSYCWLSSGNLRNMALQDSAPSLACFGCLDELFARGFGTRRIPNSFLFYVSNLDLFSSYDGRVDCPKIKALFLLLFSLKLIENNLWQLNKSEHVTYLNAKIALSSCEFF